MCGVAVTRKFIRANMDVPSPAVCIEAEAGSADNRAVPDTERWSWCVTDHKISGRPVGTVCSARWQVTALSGVRLIVHAGSGVRGGRSGCPTAYGVVPGRGGWPITTGRAKCGCSRRRARGGGCRRASMSLNFLSG